MEISILFEDKDFLIIDKPSGMVVNRSDSAKDETLQEWAEKKLGFKQEIKAQDDFFKRGGIVHRLDKETSGLLLIAKNPSSFYYLQSQFKEGKVAKKYYALVHGLLKGQGIIKTNVGRLPWNRKKFGVLPKGRMAITSYQVYQNFSSQNTQKTYTFLEVIPQTGRTHQIRIHLKYIGHPVVTDFDYGGRKRFQEDLKFCPRLFLHAYYLQFRHPTLKTLFEIKIELPNELKKVLEGLKKIKN